jgi:hypothetical protein
VSCFLRQQDNVVIFLPRISRILFVIIRNIRKISGSFFSLFCLSSQQRRKVISAELIPHVIPAMSCFLRQQDNLVIFLPRIQRMLRILIAIISLIRGYFFSLFCHPEERGISLVILIMRCFLRQQDKTLKNRRKLKPSSLSSRQRRDLITF